MPGTGRWRRSWSLGALSQARRVLLEALVAEHVSIHGGDPEKSLAALAADRSTRESLARFGDPEIEASLVHVGSRSTDFGLAEETATCSVGTATSDGQRFRILRPHAQGGLGAVFVALDAELHREVALKQILDRHADDHSSRQRFVQEAEITGGLEHPGIVPVYGLDEPGTGLGRRGPTRLAVGRLQFGRDALLHLDGEAAVRGQRHRRNVAHRATGRVPGALALEPSLERPLETIALKAMALAPADRYASARAVAEDIERWLADEPVLAHRENWVARAARFGRRHRTFATGAGVFLAVAVVALLAGTLLIDRQPPRPSATRRGCPPKSAPEANLALARKVVDEMYTQVARELGNVPRMDAYQRDLLDRAVRFYERDVSTQSSDPAGRSTAAKTWLTAAKIDRTLGGVDPPGRPPRARLRAGGPDWG